MSPDRESELVRSIQSLRVVVTTLTEVLETEYPDREEVARNYTTKKQSWQKLIAGLTILALSLPVAVLSSSGIVSVCFLGDLEHPSVCKAIPGYTEADTRNQGLVREFRTLQERSLRNEARITRLERGILR